MKDSILKNFLVIGSGTFINLLLGLFTTPIITRLVDPVEYGKFSIFTMYSSIAVMILCLGLDQALVRFYYVKKELGYKRALLFKCVCLPIIMTFIISVTVSELSFSGIIQFEFDTFLMVILCIYTMSQVLYRFSLLVIRLEYKSKLYSVLNILQKSIYVILTIILLNLIESRKLEILVICITCSFGICMIISILKQLEMWNVFKFEANKCVIPQRELLQYAYPFIISMGVTSLFQAIDKISLNKYCTYKEVGIYSSTMTLIHVFAIIQTTFNTLWSPMAVEHYSNDKNDKSFYQKGNQIITVIMFFIGLSLILVKDGFAFLLGAKYREAAYILPFLIFNPIMYTISETTVGGLIFEKKSKLQIVVAVGACITNILGNTLLVPSLGCQGAAISTGISYIVFFSLRTILSNKYYYVDFKLKKFFFLTVTVICYAFYNTFIHFNIGSIIGYVICIIIMFILYKEIIIWGIHYLYMFFCKSVEKRR